MKVLTVGCSFTFGEELRTPCKDAWPALLAKTNDWEVNNMGKGGSSNDRIIRVVFDEIDNSYDLIIVAWTNPDRFEVTYKGQPHDVNISSNKFSWTKEYYAYHHDKFHSHQKWIRNIVMLQSFFKERNQRYLFCNMIGLEPVLNHHPTMLYDKFMHENSKLINCIDSKFYIDWPKFGLTDWMGDCPKGPNGHPLELGHQRIAERINEYIRNLGWIS